MPSDAHSRLLEAVATGPAARWRKTLAGFAAAGQSSQAHNVSGRAVHQDAIDRHFNCPDLTRILDSLPQDSSTFARKPLQSMQKRSPAMLAVTLAQLQRGAHLSLAECLRRERTMVRHRFLQGDVIEGIRATIVAKDHTPRGELPTVADVTPALVESSFAPVGPAAAHPLRHLA